MLRLLVPMAVAIALGACASTSVMPISKDTYQITASVASECGATGAQQIALKQAAVETIRKGYDKFLIVGNEYSNNVRVVGYTPIVANTTTTTKATKVDKHAKVRPDKKEKDKKEKRDSDRDKADRDRKHHKTVHHTKEKIKTHSKTTYSGGQPIIDGTHDQELVVKMFSSDDPEGADAISARETLGPDWRDAVASKTTTCFGT